MTSSRSGCPGRRGRRTVVEAPSTSTGTSRCGAGRPIADGIPPDCRECGANVSNPGAQVCSMNAEGDRPSASTSSTGRSVLTPAVSSHRRDHGAQVAARGGLELDEQVVEGGVAPRVLGEVRAQPVAERLTPDVGDELLEHRGALGVRDAVEVDLDVAQVADLRDDRVGRGQLVLAVGPVLLVGAEGRPRVGPPGGLGLARRGRPLGERLVEPEVVPPAHRHEVAEPHVGELVQQREGAALDEATRSPWSGRRRPR